MRSELQLLQRTCPIHLEKHTSYVSTYVQQKRYWDINSCPGCAKDKFRTDLLAFIKLRKNKGDKIIIMLDGNENMQT